MFLYQYFFDYLFLSQLYSLVNIVSQSSLFFMAVCLIVFSNSLKEFFAIL